MRFASSECEPWIAIFRLWENIISIKVNCCFKGIVPPKVLALLLKPSKAWNNPRLQEMEEYSPHEDPVLGETLSIAIWIDSLKRFFILHTQNGHRVRKPMLGHKILSNHSCFSLQTTGEGTFSSREGLFAQQSPPGSSPWTFQYKTYRNNKSVTVQVGICTFQEKNWILGFPHLKSANYSMKLNNRLFINCTRIPRGLLKGNAVDTWSTMVFTG